MDVITDRDRLAEAFDILRQRGWFAPILWGVQMCCPQHGWESVESHPSVWWTMESDNISFLRYGQEYPVAPDIRRELEKSDDPQSWVDDNQDRVMESGMVVRTGNPDYQTICADLALNWTWAGPDEDALATAQEVVDVLVSCGLDADVPSSQYGCIMVRPSRGNLDINALLDDDTMTVVIGTNIVDVSRSDGLRLFHALGSALLSGAAGQVRQRSEAEQHGDTGATVRVDTDHD